MHSKIRRSSTHLAAGLSSLAVVGLASGQVVTVPPDLSLGDSYRLLVVTDGTTDATSTDIATYNAFVTADMTAAPALDALGTTWTAVASTSTVDARDNTGTDPSPAGDTGVPIYLLDGTRFADHYDSLWTSIGPLVGGAQVPDGSILFIPSPDGTQSSPPQVWSGSDPLGLARLPLGDAAESGLGIHVDGSHPFPNTRWMRFNQNPVTNPFPMLAMSGVLTVEAPSFCDASDGSLASCPCGNPGTPTRAATSRRARAACVSTSSPKRPCRRTA